MIRIAAVADLHAGPQSRGALAPLYQNLSHDADLLLLGGDLTREGDPADAEILVKELADAGVPIVAVLGNHDYESGQTDAVSTVLRDAGVHLLDRDQVTLDVAGKRVAIAGTKGFGGGYDAALADNFGEPEMKAWIGHAEAEAEALESIVSSLVGDVRLVLLHYSPVIDTLAGERLELYPFCGNSLLAAAIDRAGADLIIHGHAHHGSPAGATPGGVPVRNVAQPVIRKPYEVFLLDDEPQATARGWRRRILGRDGHRDEDTPAREGRQRDRRRSRWPLRSRE
jgi:Icc-related predicted phosphoesterase